jgi:hypothetical protein
MDTSDKIESIFVNSWIRIIAAMLSSFIKGFVSRTSSAASSASSASSVVLGRWGIQYDPKIIRIKIDQANEDHCGCCVPPAADVVKVVGADTAKTKTKTRYEKIQEYLLPYVM